MKRNIIVVASSKGGAGKSTTTCQLSSYAASIGETSLVVDADTQKSALNWRSMRSAEYPSIKTVGLTSPTLHEDVPELAERFSYCWVDVGGKDHKTLRSGLLLAAQHGMLLIPCEVGFFDLCATEDFYEILSEVKVMYPNFKAFTFLNKTQAGTITTRETQEAFGEIEQVAPLLQSTLPFAADFKKSIKQGIGVAEMRNPRATEAAFSSVKNLFEEVISKLSEEI